MQQPTKRDFEELFQSDSVQAIQLPWFKFDRIGTSCAGEVVRLFKVPPRDGRKGSLAVVLKSYATHTIPVKPSKEDPNPSPIFVQQGEEMNVGVPDTQMHQQQLEGLEPGDLLQIKFADEKNTGKGNPAKIYEFRRKKMKKQEVISF